MRSLQKDLFTNTKSNAKIARTKNAYQTKAIATLDKNSAQHHMLYQHEIDEEGVEIIDRSTKWKQRLILEAWNSVREVNSIRDLKHRQRNQTTTTNSNRVKTVRSVAKTARK